VLKTFAGERLFGASHGTGVPWVLALPGWGRSHRDFDRVLEGMDAVALDLPGFGAAPPPPEPWTTAGYAAHVAAVLDDLAPKVVIIGHSFGGRVGVHMAAAHPDRVAALVLTGVPLVRSPGASPPAVSTGYRVARALHRAGLISDERIERRRRRSGSEDYRQASGVMRDVLVKAVNETYEQPLAAYAGPIELVWGEQDDQAPLAVAQAAAGLCRHPTLTVLPAVGHFLPIEAPEALIEAVRRHRPALATGPVVRPPEAPASAEPD